MTDEIKYEDLTIAQQHAADLILKNHSRIYNWPRQSGKTIVTKYVIQEMKKKDRQ